ncbi:MAG: 4-(cytidine 5'-diphospho)-2-C-methyl-D-erythritol kinase [Elusimicrobia bacterium]|nr:4-(cytidine 5'-diphospho)-2-C-methyl-D-erythritol kinase [Elusimicrobiota bacterium]
MAEVKLKANAKVNLFLDVLNKRKDGYHNIKTIFQEISLSDDIFIREIKKGIKIFCSNPKIPTGKKNLVYKAADLLKKYFNIKKGLEIKIKKRIPIGAGLGGGSSDAAAVLKGLNKLWNLKISKNIIIKMAKQIGADVPFFIEGGRCLATGIGDKLKKIPVKDEFYVIVKPNFEISTKFVYSRLKVLTKSKKKYSINGHYNRLEDVVIPLYPEIKRIKDKLVFYGADYSLMSGSGSCVFGIVKNKTTGGEIRKHLGKEGYSVWLVHAVKGS